eukprot:TRINITY_DN1383_c0_g1_i1.p1 TRINITY_DN1383_c0_g1~~TRINITY_DN1383_c0_g1_i1.p1  ORF type:complete len:325 (+),score=52.56 TRINITY_DN1383_c0_g1_i1:244-1218(+)
MPVANASRVTVCVGDLHGHYDRLLKLWQNIEATVGSSNFVACRVIFLGDYCDRGPDTKKVIDFLVALPARYPHQQHVFLAGNHDLAFAAFIGALPPAPPDVDLSKTWGAFQDQEYREGWYAGDGHRQMHVQGRRWGGLMRHSKDSTYDASFTFQSYGVRHGDRQALIEAVPESHKCFLRNLVWVYEEEGVDVGAEESGYKGIIAVHAGLEASVPMSEQLQALRMRDVTIPRVEALSGRKSVWKTPLELEQDGTLVISGHHGVLRLERHRLIVDESGGLGGRPIAAVILPQRVVVRDTDKYTTAFPAMEQSTPLTGPIPALVPNL